MGDLVDRHAKRATESGAFPQYVRQDLLWQYCEALRLLSAAVKLLAAFAADEQSPVVRAPLFSAHEQLA